MSQRCLKLWGLGVQLFNIIFKWLSIVLLDFIRYCSEEMFTEWTQTLSFSTCLVYKHCKSNPLFLCFASLNCIPTFNCNFHQHFALISWMRGESGQKGDFSKLKSNLPWWKNLLPKILLDIFDLYSDQLNAALIWRRVIIFLLESGASVKSMPD